MLGISGKIWRMEFDENFDYFQLFFKNSVRLAKMILSLTFKFEEC